MLTPQMAVELVLNHHCDNPFSAASNVLDGLCAAGFAVVNRQQYLDAMEQMALMALERSESIQ